MTTKGHTLVEVMMIDVSMDRPKVSRSAFPFNLKSISLERTFQGTSLVGL